MTVFKRKDRKTKPWVFRDAEGISQSFDTRKEAMAASNKYAVENNGPVPINKKITFADYYDEWVETYKKANISAVTYMKYKTSGNTIRRFFKNTKLYDINRSLYQRFLNDYADDQFGHTHSKESVSKLHIHAHQAIIVAVDDGVIPKDFAAHATVGGNKGKPKDSKFLEAKDFERLRDYANKYADPKRIGLSMIQFAIYTGARIGEVGGMTWDDVDEKNNTISINKTFRYPTFKPDYDTDGNVIWPERADDLDDDEVFGPTKNESSVRVIDVSPVLMASLHTLILHQKINAINNPNHLLFIGQKGIPLASKGANEELKRAMKYCGIVKKDFTFHGLRHSHGSYLLDKGIDLKYVSVRLGHENIGVTIKTYTHVLNRLKKEEAALAVKVL